MTTELLESKHWAVKRMYMQCSAISSGMTKERFPYLSPARMPTTSCSIVTCDDAYENTSYLATLVTPTSERQDWFIRYGVTLLSGAPIKVWSDT